jgi:hypothetical protein
LRSDAASLVAQVLEEITIVRQKGERIGRKPEDRQTPLVAFWCSNHRASSSEALVRQPRESQSSGCWLDTPGFGAGKQVVH